jgi:hypothetical protein
MGVLVTVPCHRTIFALVATSSGDALSVRLLTALGASQAGI